MILMILTYLLFFTFIITSSMAYFRMKKVNRELWSKTKNPLLVHGSAKMWFLKRAEIDDIRFHIYKYISGLSLIGFVFCILFGFLFDYYA